MHHQLATVVVSEDVGNYLLSVCSEPFVHVVGVLYIMVQLALKGSMVLQSIEGSSGSREASVFSKVNGKKNT